MLKLYRADVPAKFIPDFYLNVVDKKFKGNIDKLLMYVCQSLFASEVKLSAFLSKPVLKTLESDPVCLTSASFNKVAGEASNGLSQFRCRMNTGRRLWIAALMEMVPEKTQYPDANFQCVFHTYSPGL